jgi:hypothetical protein
MLNLGASAGRCLSQLVPIIAPPFSLVQRFGALELKMSRGLPCMVEIYDQDNWVLLMVDSHGAGSCKRFLDGAEQDVWF